MPTGRIRCQRLWRLRLRRLLRFRRLLPLGRRLPRLRRLLRLRWPLGLLRTLRLLQLPGFLMNPDQPWWVMTFVIAAFLTPPDALSQSFMAVPMYLLYEIGIVLSRLLLKKKAEEADAQRT